MLSSESKQISPQVQQMVPRSVAEKWCHVLPLSWTQACWKLRLPSMFKKPVYQLYKWFGNLIFRFFSVHFVHSKWKSAVQLSVWPTYFLRTGMAFTLSFAHSIKSTNAPHSRSTKQSHFLTFQVFRSQRLQQRIQCPNFKLTPKSWNIRLQTSWTLWSIFIQCPPALDQAETCTLSRCPQCAARKNSLHAVLLALRAAGCVEDGQPEWLPTARRPQRLSVRLCPWISGSTLLVSQATEKTKKRNRTGRHLTFCCIIG